MPYRVVVVLIVVTSIMARAAAQQPEESKQSARTLVAKAEAAEMRGTLRDMSDDPFDRAIAALESYRTSHPDDVEAIVLSARLGRLREVRTPVTASAPHMEADLETAAAARHARVDALESLLDHALATRNAEVYYWKARLFGVRTPPLLEKVAPQDVPDADRAIDSMKKAVELAPGNALYAEVLGLYLVEANRLSEATVALAGVAKGRHPIYLLLKDLEQVPIPPGAIPDVQQTERLILIKQERGEMLDYTTLRIRSWVIPGPASKIEELYRARWPGFEFFKTQMPMDEAPPVTVYGQLFRWDGSGLVPLGASRTERATDKDLEGKLTMSLIEFRPGVTPPTPSAALLPESERGLYCGLSIFNRRVVGH